MITRLLRLSSTLALLAAPLCQAQDTALRSSLEGAYARWSHAVEAKDAAAWAGAITMHRQVSTRNLIVSQGEAFPKSVFESPLLPADTSKLRLLEAQAVGDTAHLLYFGKVNIGGDPEEIPENLLMLKFFSESGVWKFDSSKMIHLRTRQDLLSKLKSGDAPDFLDLPEFTPPGKAPAVPAICPVPQYISGGTLQSIGYETEVTINGFEYFVRDNVLKVFVLGGLKKGENTISLKAKQIDIPKNSDRALEVDLFLKPTAASEKGKRVFHYEFNGKGTPSAAKSSWTLTLPASGEVNIISED